MKTKIETASAHKHVLKRTIVVFDNMIAKKYLIDKQIVFLRAISKEKND